MTAQAEKVLRITKTYLGPASRVFLERQTKYHMGGLAFDEVGPEQLPGLIYWVKVGSELIINNKSQLLVADLMKEMNVSIQEVLMVPRMGR